MLICRHVHTHVQNTHTHSHRKMYGKMWVHIFCSLGIEYKSLSLKLQSYSTYLLAEVMSF